MQNLTEEEKNKLCKIQILNLLNAYNNDLTQKSISIYEVSNTSSKKLCLEHVIQMVIYNDGKLLASIITPVDLKYNEIKNLLDIE